MMVCTVARYTAKNARELNALFCQHLHTRPYTLVLRVHSCHLYKTGRVQRIGTGRLFTGKKSNRCTSTTQDRSAYSYCTGRVQRPRKSMLTYGYYTARVHTDDTEKLRLQVLNEGCPAL